MNLRYTLPLGLAAALLLAASRSEVGPTPERTFGAVTTGDPGPRTYTGPAKGPSARPDALYRWRGADGQVHVQSQPPPEGVRAEVFRLREDARGEDSAGHRPAATPSNSASGSAADPLSVYSPRGFTELKDRLGSTVTRLNGRARLLEDLQRAR